MLRRDEVVAGARGKVARRFEQHRQAGGTRRRILAVSDQGPGDTAAQRRAPRRLERRVEHVLIERVHELILESQRQVGKFIFGASLDEDVHPLEEIQALFDLGRVELHGLAHDCRIELGPLHARRKQQRAIALIDLLDFSRDHAAHRFRQVARHVRHRARQHPRARPARRCCRSHADNGRGRP